MFTGVTAPGSARAPETHSLSGSACLLVLLSQDHTPPAAPRCLGAGVSRLPSSSRSPEPSQTAGHSPLPAGPGLTLLLSRSLGEGWDPRPQRTEMTAPAHPLFSCPTQIGVPPTAVRPDKPRVGVQHRERFLAKENQATPAQKAATPWWVSGVSKAR